MTVMRWVVAVLSTFAVFAAACADVSDDAWQTVSETISDQQIVETARRSDVVGWLSGFELAVPVEQAYPIVTSSWGLAAGSIMVGATRVTVPADIPYPDNCGLLVMIMNHWAGPGARAAGCYVMVGLDDAGDAAWLRAFGGGRPAEWNPEDGWSQLFEPEDEITVEATAFKDGLMIIGPSEAPVAVVVDLNVTNTCPLPIADPGLFELPSTEVLGILSVETGAITQVFCETYVID